MTLVTAVGSGSSILTPEQVEDLVIKPLAQQSVAMRVSTRLMTASHETRLPILERDVSTEFTPEATETPVSETALTEIVVVPQKLAGLVPVSSELVADSNEDALNLVGASLVRDLQIKIDASFYAAPHPTDRTGWAVLPMCRWSTGARSPTWIVSQPL